MRPHAMYSIAVAALTMVAMTSATHAATTEWKPDRNVELSVGSGAGSGSDRLARVIQGVWQNRDLVKPSSTVVNKTAALAMSHIHQQAGNPHYLLHVSSTLLSNHVTGNSGNNRSCRPRCGERANSCSSTAIAQRAASREP